MPKRSSGETKGKDPLDIALAKIRADMDKAINELKNAVNELQKISASISSSTRTPSRRSSRRSTRRR